LTPLAPTGQVELPLDAYERFKDLQHRILTHNIDPEVARYELIELLSPHWDHLPEPWERIEVSLKPTTMRGGRIS
jgi:hypothetical protein